MDLSLAKCRAFVTVAETGSYTKASQKLGCTQSGLSKMISDLENDWNVKLLERGRFGASLTAEGQSLLPAVQAYCRSADRISETVDSIVGLERGHVRIGVFSSVATHWVPQAISILEKDHPGIDYELLMGDYTEIEKWLLEGRVDIGFLKLPVDSRLKSKQLHRDRLMAVVPKNDPLASSEVFPIEGFSGKPFLLLEKGEKSEVSEVLERNSVSPEIKFVTWDDYAVMSMVERGLGYAILPELILKRIPYDVSVLPLDVPAYRDICIAARDWGEIPHAAKIFMGKLMDVLTIHDDCK